MKTYHSIGYLFIFFALLFTSCDDAIDLAPPTEITESQYWKTSADLKNYVLHFYPQFYNYSRMVEDIALHSDDMVTPSISTVLNGERTLSTGTWSSEWANIRSVNVFFDSYRNCRDDFSSYRHYVGEALFFRAWFYFSLLRRYGGVPYYVSEVQLEDNAALFKPRDSRTLVTDSIIADLDRAAGYLRTRAVAGNNNTVTREAALAFKSRVALYTGTWEKYHAGTAFATPGANPEKYFQACVDAAEELINSGIELYATGNPGSDYFDLFGKSGTDMNSIDEILLCRSFSAAVSPPMLTNVQRYISYTDCNGKGVTWDLVSSYLGKTGQPVDYPALASTYKGNNFLTQIKNLCDARLSGTVWMPGDIMSYTNPRTFTGPAVDQGGLSLCPTGFQVKKTGNPRSTSSGVRDGNDDTGLIILRFGEVLLNYAEALYELDGTVAYAALNRLRTRVGMPNFTVNAQSSDPSRIDYGYAVSDALYEIRRERRVEMALEGYRDDDLLRWKAHHLFAGKRPMGYPFLQSEFPAFHPDLDANGLIDYYRNALPNGYAFRENQDYLYSIPQQERVLNPSLTQNPGW
ncbi:MAG: RagB/SusD family nutrient uptake outer membrane protein [Bacteroidales bacterium]|jgi:hypothetical protein|nr:RagB/SusD family nutrient uptake outer membrane protein [Bacteroidales bacterium]